MFFISQNTLSHIGKVEGIRPFEKIKNEPMFFNCGYDFVLKNAGPLTHEILRKMDCSNLGPIDKYVINTRVTMCMKGQYPSIPGWHGDNVPRCKQYSQPELELVDSKVRHALCIIASTDNHSNTQFLNDQLQIPYDSSDVWSSVDRYLNNYDECINLKTYHVREGEIIEFGQLDIHRAMEVKNAGWRLFFKISNIGTICNEIRNQVQIYTQLNKGW